MTQINDEILDSNLEKDTEEMTQENAKIPTPIPKVSRFGVQPSKFGKGPTQSFQNPIQK